MRPVHHLLPQLARLGVVGADEHEAAVAHRAVDPDLPGRLLRSEAEAATEHPVGVGVRLLDDLLQIQWYLRQLARMSKGLPPDPRLSPWRTILGALGQMYVELATSWWRREGHALDAPAPATGTPATKAATSASRYRSVQRPV